MAINLQTGSEPSVTSIVSGIINDFQELIKQQLDLFKTEVAADVQKTKEGAVALSVGLGALFLGCALLCVMLVHLLASLVPLWVSYLLVGGGVTVVGAGLTIFGWKQFQSVSADQSVKALQENLEWKTKPN
jgi:uncharacterized membrane protein YqjE